MGWELFSQYVRALHEAKPKFFIYENNKSMARAIYESISETFGFEPIMINSALVSAQNRQRYYWVGKRNEDGSYSKVDVRQPKDRGILLRDILDGVADREKSRAIISSIGRTTTREYFIKNQGQMKCEPVNTTTGGKSQTIKSQYSKTDVNNICKYSSTYGASGVAEPVGTTKDDKAFTVTAYYSTGQNVPHTLKKHIGSMVAEPLNTTAPVCVASRGRYVDTDSRSVKAECGTYQHLEAREDGKTNALTTVSKDNYISEPVCMRQERTAEGKALRKDYEAGNIHHGFNEYRVLQPRTDGKSNTVSTVLKDNPICVPVQVGAMPRPSGEISTSQGFRIYDTNAKSVTLKGNAGGAGGKTGLYAIPIESGKQLTENEMDYMVRSHSDRRWNHCQRPRQDEKAKCLVANISKGVPYNVCAIPVEFEDGIPLKAISVADGKTYTVYKVEQGLITIKEKTYPIKLHDGYYIIRKLTVSECKRLQTVPEWYEFPVSNTAAYKMLGNGWTVEVIVHLLKSITKEV